MEKFPIFLKVHTFMSSTKMSNPRKKFPGVFLKKKDASYRLFNQKYVLKI